MWWAVVISWVWGWGYPFQASKKRYLQNILQIPFQNSFYFFASRSRSRLLRRNSYIITSTINDCFLALTPAALLPSIAFIASTRKAENSFVICSISWLMLLLFGLRHKDRTGNDTHKTPPTPMSRNIIAMLLNGNNATNARLQRHQ